MPGLPTLRCPCPHAGPACQPAADVALLGRHDVPWRCAARWRGRGDRGEGAGRLPTVPGTLSKSGRRWKQAGNRRVAGAAAGPCPGFCAAGILVLGAWRRVGHTANARTQQRRGREECKQLPNYQRSCPVSAHKPLQVARSPPPPPAATAVQQHPCPFSARIEQPPLGSS